MSHVRFLFFIMRPLTDAIIRTRCMFSAIVLVSLTVLSLATPCETIDAAILVDARLVMDGSNDPPGDKLDVRLLLSPAESNITLEVRAFLISMDKKSLVTQVNARGQNNRDKDGRFLATFIVKRPAIAEVVQFPAVIAYADLDIPVGTHELAYEIRGLCDGQVEFVQPTALSLVTISNEPRKEMELREVTTESVSQTRTVRIVLGGQSTRGSRPMPTEEQEIEITESIPQTKTRLQKLVANIPGAFRRSDISKNMPAAGSAPSPVPSRQLSGIRPPSERVIYFATNRGRVEGERAPASQFGSDLVNEVTWGECVVNIPVQHHRIGVLDAPSFWEKLDPDEHFLIESLRILNLDQFQSQIHGFDVLLFVHGYKYTFDRAVLRTAQLHYDLEFPGRPITFSWPSTGELTGYLRDAEQAESSVEALATVLQALITRNSVAQTSPPRKLHVIAHSMGNRIFLAALNRLSMEKRIPTEFKPLGQVILAAPDVNQTNFNQLLPVAIDAAEQTTLYYCNKDNALKISTEINKDPPVGLTSFFQDGLDTICADHASTDMSGLSHGYFAESNLVLLDMKLILQGHRPTNRRPPLAESTILSGRRHWSFVSTRVAENGH